MRFNHGTGATRAGKARRARTRRRLRAAGGWGASLLTVALLSSCQASCGSRHAANGRGPKEMRILLDMPPVTLNPRQSLDANGQRLGSLLFMGLTRLDSELVPRPDLAEDWEPARGGAEWRFTIREDALDHAGREITPELVARCLEQYRDGQPYAATRAGFGNWKSTRVRDGQVVVELDKPDPYFDRNASLLRYFTVAAPPAAPGAPVSEPCTEPAPGQSIVASGPYRPTSWDPSPESGFVLLPTDPSWPVLRFSFVADDNARAIRFARGEVDASQNSLSLTKTEWLRRTHGDLYDYIQRDGVRVNYLSFNLRHPLLSRREVRQAIAHAIPREEIVTSKFKGFAKVADSILSPFLPESHQVALAYDVAQANSLLDGAGLPRGADGVRFGLRYKTTPVREGFETAQIIQAALARVGIALTLDVVEPAVFLASTRAGGFDLYASRWTGVADGSILYRTLRTGQATNRVGYSDPAMDKLLDAAMGEADADARAKLFADVQIKQADDLPYFPLWYWANGILVRKGVVGLRATDISLSGGFDPFMKLRFAADVAEE